MAEENKTEKPTAKRRSESRNKGSVAQSKEVSSTFILLGSLGVFMLASSWMYDRLAAIMRSFFQKSGSFHLMDASMPLLMEMVYRETLILLAPLFAAVIFIGIVSNVAQFGFLLTSYPLIPKLDKFLNPINGLKRVFSIRSLVELAKSLIKMLFIGSIAWIIIRKELSKMPGLIRMDIVDIMMYTGTTAYKICFYVCLGLLFLAAVDFAFQKWRHEEDLKMSKQEVKDEHKQQEGDPKVKARIRRNQMQFMRNRMMAAVPKADVVITNPTRLAIALSYDARTMAAPKVVAKGAGHLAARIREIAEEHHVMLMEHKSLAQTLYKSVEVDHFVPPDLYRAVAEVLAYVYRLKSGRGQGPMR